LLGIIFTGGEGPKAQIIKRIIESAKKDAVIIAADSGFDAALDAGIKPDWVIGDMDSVKNQLDLASLPPQCVIRHERDKDFTDTELAFLLAKEKGADEIWIIGGGGGRIDHLFGIRSLFERENFPRRWITSSEDIYCIEGENRQWTTESGAIVSVFPAGEGSWEAESIGLKWALNSVSWNRGFFGLSNVAVDEVFSIKAKKGRFMVILINELRDMEDKDIEAALIR